MVLELTYFSILILKVNVIAGMVYTCNHSTQQD